MEVKTKLGNECQNVTNALFVWFLITKTQMNLAGFKSQNTRKHRNIEVQKMNQSRMSRLFESILFKKCRYTDKALKSCYVSFANESTL